MHVALALCGTTLQPCSTCRDHRIKVCANVWVAETIATPAGSPTSLRFATSRGRVSTVDVAPGLPISTSASSSATRCFDDEGHELIILSRAEDVVQWPGPVHSLRISGACSFTEEIQKDTLELHKDLKAAEARLQGLRFQAGGELGEKRNASSPPVSAATLVSVGLLGRPHSIWQMRSEEGRCGVPSKSLSMPRGDRLDDEEPCAGVQEEKEEAKAEMEEQEEEDPLAFGPPIGRTKNTQQLVEEAVAKAEREALAKVRQRTGL